VPPGRRAASIQGPRAEVHNAAADTQLGVAPRLDGSPQLPKQFDIQAKIEQYGLLRRALRALEASCPDASAFGLEASVQQICGFIAELRSPDAAVVSDGAAQISSARQATMDNLERALDALQSAVIDQIRSIPMSQLRATLPAIKRQNPEELKALLDLCLIAHATGATWWNLIDYLITLLSHEEKGGRRYVARDPTGVTPMLQELCAAADFDRNELTDALAEMFHKARTEIDRGIPAGPIVAKLRSAKHQAMETLLIPELLRAITAYNVAVSNQRADMLETQRALEEAEFEAFEKKLGTRAASPSEPAAAKPPSRAPHFSGAALDAPALRDIVAAIGCRLRRQDPGAGPAPELAAALDLSKLSAYEKAALRDPEPGPLASVIACAASVSLIAKSLDALGDRLDRVGISAEQLQAQWVSELEKRIRAEAAALVSEGAHEEARRIAEVRTRLLQKPDEHFNAWRLERSAHDAGPTSYARAAPVAPAEEAPRRFKVSVGAAGWRSVAVSLLCAVALAVGASMYFTEAKNPKVDFFSPAQLAKISPQIESGYRNGKGEGPAFVGTLRPQWEALSTEEREALGHAIQEALAAQGISEFMFFDERRELKLRYAAGRLAVY
jgi:hypothetical protein